MTVWGFDQLDEMVQAEAVWDCVVIGDREDEDHKILLYQIDNFYVEVFYHKEYNFIRKFNPFTFTELLHPYLSQINLVRKLNN